MNLSKQRFRVNAFGIIAIVLITSVYTAIAAVVSMLAVLLGKGLDYIIRWALEADFSLLRRIIDVFDAFNIVIAIAFGIVVSLALFFTC